MLLVRAMEGAMTPAEVMELDAAFAWELMAATGAMMEKARKASDGATERRSDGGKRGGRSEVAITDMGQLRNFLAGQKGL